MKSISYKTLRLVLNGSIILYLLGAVLLLTFFVKKGVSDDWTSFTISFTTRENYKIDTTMATVKVIKPGVTEASLVTDNVGIRFKTDSYYIKTVFAVVIAACFSYSFIILFCLRSFVNSLEKSHPFTKSNVTRLRIIGLMLVAIEPLYVGINYIMRSLVDDYFLHTLSTKTVFGQFGYWLGYNLSKGSLLSSWLVAGLIILVISEVFKQGLVIKEEQDLTI